MDPWRLRLGPGVPDLGALGVATPDELLPGPGEAPSGGARGETLRHALPSGETALLRRWGRAPLGALLAARLGAPRSESLAEREWNLLCHLSAHGVGIPDLLAVGARGRGFVARRSFLVVREPQRMVPVDRWLAMDVGADRRRRGLASLEAALAALDRAGVDLPQLTPGEVWLSAAEAVTTEGAEEDCAAHVLGDLRASSAAGGLRRTRVPGVVVSSAAGGRFAARPEPGRRADLRARLGLGSP